MATLVERHSRFAMLIQVPSKETEAVVAALSQHVRKLPATLRRSLMWDRGLEMATHKDLKVATDVQVYFCDPQSPWQRAQTKTLIYCCGNTSPEARTCPPFLERCSTTSRCA
jgi:IS30 family transposase